MNWILIKAIIKARKNGLLHLRPVTGPTRLDCLADKCAKCCRTLGTPVVTPQEAENIGSSSILKGKHAMFVKSDNSVCYLLKDGLCSVYPLRPKGCREYPWYNINGRLYYDSGCPGIKHDKDQRPNVDDTQPFKNFFPLTPQLVLWLVQRVCVKK
jgi:Fe-S-cluster containining protein